MCPETPEGVDSAFSPMECPNFSLFVIVISVLHKYTGQSRIFSSSLLGSGLFRNASEKSFSSCSIENKKKRESRDGSQFLQFLKQRT